MQGNALIGYRYRYRVIKVNWIPFLLKLSYILVNVLIIFRDFFKNINIHRISNKITEPNLMDLWNQIVRSLRRKFRGNKKKTTLLGRLKILHLPVS